MSDKRKPVLRNPVCLCRYDDDDVVTEGGSGVEPILLPAPPFVDMSGHDQQSGGQPSGAPEMGERDDV